VYIPLSLGISIYPQNILAQPLSPIPKFDAEKNDGILGHTSFFHPNHLALLLKKHILPVSFESS
jgi:hypothetical protein